MLPTVFALVTLTSLVAARDDFYDVTVYELGGSVGLDCNGSYEYGFAPNDTSAVWWMLPNLTIINHDVDRYALSNKNLTLFVTNVSQTDLGLYHCMLTAENVTGFLARVGLNAEGPYFEDMWQKYEMNTIIGLSAFFGYLVLAAGCWLVYHFRYIAPDEDEKRSSKHSYIPTVDGSLTSVEHHAETQAKAHVYDDYTTKHDPGTDNKGYRISEDSRGNDSDESETPF